MVIAWPSVIAARRESLHKPVRFGAVGLAAALVQLGSLTALVQLHVPHVVANFIALLLATQFNFLLSALVIWPERAILHRRPREILQRLVAFNASSGATLLLNEAVFAAAVPYLPYLLAALCGMAVAAPLNFLIQHYLIFRVRGDKAKAKSDGLRNPGLDRLPGL